MSRDARSGLGVSAHGPNLDEWERTAVHADSLLHEKAACTGVECGHEGS